MAIFKRYEENDDSSNPTDTKLYTAEELAKKINFSTQTLDNLRARGGGPRFLKTSEGRGGKVLYDWNDVLIYLESRKRTSTSDRGSN